MHKPEREPLETTTPQQMTAVSGRKPNWQAGQSEARKRDRGGMHVMCRQCWRSRGSRPKCHSPRCSRHSLSSSSASLGAGFLHSGQYRPGTHQTSLPAAAHVGHLTPGSCDGGQSRPSAACRMSRRAHWCRPNPFIPDRELEGKGRRHRAKHAALDGREEWEMHCSEPRRDV